MKQGQHVIRLLTLMLTIASIGALATSGIQNAYAMASPSIGADPAPMIVGFGGNKIVISASQDATQPHADVRVGVGEPTMTLTGNNGSPDTPAAPGGDCTLPAVNTNPNARSYWILRNLANTADVEFDIGGIGLLAGVVTIPFTGPGAVNIGYSGVASGPASAQWVDQVNAAAASIAFSGAYQVGHCGYDLFNTAGSINLLYGTVSQLPAQFPVGGSIIPIDTAALMIAGLTSGLGLIYPIVAAGIGLGALAYKLRRQ